MYVYMYVCMYIYTHTIIILHFHIQKVYNFVSIVTIIAQFPKESH